MREYSHAYVPESGQTPYYAILEPEIRELYRFTRSALGILELPRSWSSC